MRADQGQHTKDERWDVEVVEERINKIHLFGFIPDDA
jgi:hypothetical protein